MSDSYSASALPIDGYIAVGVFNGVYAGGAFESVYTYDPQYHTGSYGAVTATVTANRPNPAVDVSFVYVPATGDEDGDGLSNLDEYTALTDIFKADTDGDGFTDGGAEEQGPDGDPLDPGKPTAGYPVSVLIHGGSISGPVVHSFTISAQTGQTVDIKDRENGGAGVFQALFEAGIPGNGKTLNDELTELGFIYDDDAKNQTGQVTAVAAGLGPIQVVASDIRKTVTVINDVDAYVQTYKVVSGRDQTVSAPAKSGYEFDGYTVTKRGGVPVIEDKVTASGVSFTLTAVSEDIELTLNYITNEEAAERGYRDVRALYVDAETRAEIGGVTVRLYAGVATTVTAPTNIAHYGLPTPAEVTVTWNYGDNNPEIVFEYTRDKVTLTFVAKGKTIGSSSASAPIEGVSPVVINNIRVAEYYDYSAAFNELTAAVLAVNSSYTAPSGPKGIMTGGSDMEIEVLYTLPNPSGGGFGGGGDSGGGSSGGSGSSGGDGMAMVEYDKETVVELPNNVTVTVPAGSKRGDDDVIIIPPDAEGWAKLPGYDGVLGTKDDVTVTLPGGSEIRPDRGTLHLGRYNADVRVGTSDIVISLHPGAVVESAPFSEFGYRVISELPFTDVTSGDWFEGDVQFAYWHEIVSGTDANFYSPDRPTTRGMIVAMLHNLIGKPSGAALDNPFADVTGGAWYEDAVKWASANGLVNGYGDGQFGPDDVITREQMATILVRFMQYLDVDIEPRGEAASFRDADEISGFAGEAVERMNRYGIIKGTGDGALAPKKTATRAEVAALLHRFVVLLMRGEG
jgi:uncharacterized membrane protein YgcG